MLGVCIDPTTHTRPLRLLWNTADAMGAAVEAGADAAHYMTEAQYVETLTVVLTAMQSLCTDSVRQRLTMRC